MLTVKQDTVKSSNRLFWAFLLTVKQDTVKSCNRIFWAFLFILTVARAGEGQQIPRPSPMVPSWHTKKEKGRFGVGAGLRGQIPWLVGSYYCKLGRVFDLNCCSSERDNPVPAKARPGLHRGGWAGPLRSHPREPDENATIVRASRISPTRCMHPKSVPSVGIKSGCGDDEV